MSRESPTFCPLCGGDSIIKLPDEPEDGIYYIAEDTGTSTEFVADCAHFECNTCKAQTIIQVPDEPDENY